MGILKDWLRIKQPEQNRSLGLETESEYYLRWTSIRVIYYTGFVVYLAFGIVATGIWPYLKSLDPDVGKVFLTYVFSMPAIIQLVCSPLFGWWNDKLTSIRIPMVLFLLAFIIGHILYAVVRAIPDHRKHVLLFSRALVGLSLVSCTIYRAYMSAATTVAERTKTLSYLALAHTSGLLFGSVFQAIFSILGEDGYRFLGVFHVNMYTAAGWFCVLLGIVNLILMHPSIFQDQNVALKEAIKNNEVATTEKVLKSTELIGLPISMMLMAFALLMFLYTAWQTLLSPIALDQFNWTNEESLFYLGILMTAGALISCVLFLLLDFLCKRFSESNVLVYGAMLALFFSQILMIPVGNEPITATSDGLNATNGNSSCPSIQDWCRWIPPVGKIQFTIAYTLLCTAFSIGTTLSQSVFSKLLGPRPQGTWMALLTCAGSAARILGPGSVTVYVLYGTYWTFGVCTVLAGTIFIWMWVYRDRLQSTKLVQPKVEEELKVLNPTRLTQ
ncbi:major facilitator superfamily domain-containing protein 8-like isoform X1 [Toxorhynchites rutilus septentrionalis]|uniref:major facilitator superfamily domain-containing protein 8-like isoform X1 n=1 Tax=Toxorhynchites rutilus septentrionalis TaxID=329112 RepID=UPI00247996BA|nr:major facilitator superfamily domain-containing protein 8-like isoform X1 [Toxorhynchites rutilus septentrionalis]